LLVLFKVNAFPFNNKDKSHIFQPRSTFTLCSAAPCLFCFEAICDCYFFKLICFKLIGWFNHHNVTDNVFPLIRSVCYRFLHCDYRKLHRDYKKLHCNYRNLHCDYRKLHCCLGLTALKSTNHSRVISLCILLIQKYWMLKWSAKINASLINVPQCGAFIMHSIYGMSV
jgi:hypothetical protein